MVKTKNCVICGKRIEGKGNNAQPIDNGLCCDKCNIEYVIPERMNIQGEENVK